MSLVIALSASRKAVIGADRRAIAFLGSCSQLEEELYSGRIKDDRELEARAKETGEVIQISDGREKVWRRGDILVGEVTEISARLSRRRRIYVAPGVSLQVDITSDNGSGGTVKIRAWGGVGCIIFGNRFTQKLAADEVALAGGRVNEALIEGILSKAGERTASVSREHTVLSSDAILSDAKAVILRVLLEDCRESGWRLCDPQ
ncbi:MAG: DUF2121 domain-containing protein [Methanothrix sp.]|nr:DUF2121 domain-containing protein [Methanothrix sp.]